MQVLLCRRSIKTLSPHSEVRVCNHYERDNTFLLLCFVGSGLVYGPAIKDRFFLLGPGVPVLVQSSCSSLPFFRLSTDARPNSLQAQRRRSAQIVQIVGMSLAEFPWGEVGSCPTD